MVTYRGISPVPIGVPPWLQKPTDPAAVVADPSFVVEGYGNFDVDTMAEITLQEIGAVELSMLTRYDSLDGVQMAYSPLVSRTRMISYSANNLMGQPNSLLTGNGQDALNSAHYVNGEINRGYDIVDTPLDMDIQVAVNADIVPFSTTGEVYEVV